MLRGGARRATRWTAVMTAVVALLTGACAGAKDASTKASEPPTTRGQLPIDFSQPGPYRVGVLELNITPQAGGATATTGTTGASSTSVATPSTPIEGATEPTAAPAVATRTAVVYYPADPGPPGQYRRVESYSTLDAFPEALRGSIPPEFVQTVKLEAFAEPPANREGPFPVVIHSHGEGSHYLFESRHAQHLASWGFVVAAPDHKERSVTSQFLPPSDDASATLGEQDVTDLRNTLQALRSQNLIPGGRLQGALNLDQVAAEGHSAGGRAAVLFAADPVVKTFIGQAPTPPFPAGTLDPSVPLDRQIATIASQLAEVTPPAKPSMLIAADRDRIVPLVAVQVIYRWLAPPKTLAVLKNAGHNAFTDLCPPIRARGGLSQYSDRLPAMAQIFDRTEDGCLPDNLDPDRGYALVNQLTVAQLRWVFGIDDTRASLDPAYLQKNFGDALESIDYQGA